MKKVSSIKIYAKKKNKKKTLKHRKSKSAKKQNWAKETHFEIYYKSKKHRNTKRKKKYIN